MKILRPVLFACLTFAALCLLDAVSVSAQSSSVSVATELPTSRLLSRFGLERAWWSQATLNPKRDKLKYMVLDEENVYLQGTGGTVTAFDADSGSSMGDQLADEDTPSPELLLHNSEIEAWVKQWLDELSDRQREVIERRYGLNGHEVATLEQLARTLKVTRERVRQIQAEALDKLRARLRRRGLSREALL